MVQEQLFEYKYVLIYCIVRRAAGAGMVVATIIGGLILCGLLATMCSQRRKRAKAWAPISS